MTNLTLFRQELKRHQVRWCQDEGCSIRHRRGSGYVNYSGTEDEMRVVHFCWYTDDVAQLFVGLHEIGHVVGDHRHTRRGTPTYMRPWQREKEATEFAFTRLATLHVRVPKQLREAETRYWMRWVPKTLKARWAA